MCDFVCRLFQDPALQDLLQRKAREAARAWRRLQFLKWLLAGVVLMILLLAVTFVAGIGVNSKVG